MGSNIILISTVQSLLNAQYQLFHSLLLWQSEVKFASLLEWATATRSKFYFIICKIDLNCDKKICRIFILILAAKNTSTPRIRYTCPSLKANNKPRPNVLTSINAGPSQ